MKTKLPALFAIIVIAGCQSQDDLTAKKKELEKLKKEQEDVQFKIMELEKEILAMDSSALTVKKKGKLVTTFTAQAKPFASYIDIQGTAESDLNVAVSAEMGGEVVKLWVEEGDAVKQGQLLIQLDDAILQKQLADVEVSLELATTVFEKQQKLWDKKIGSEMQYLQAKSNKESLEAKKQTLQAQLSKTRITAPVSGTAENISIKLGEMARPGFPLLNVVNLDMIKVKADVPERYVAAVKKGGDVLVEFPSLGIRKQATIASVGNIIHPSNRTFSVEVNLPNKDKALKANLLALLKFSEYSNPQALTVPTRIIQREKEQDFVYVVAHNSDPVATKRIITTGKTYGGETEVLSGLSDGDVVVNDGFQYITDGALVEIQ